MSTKDQKIDRQITALRVKQWLPSWDDVHYDPTQLQAIPEKKHFYIFSIKASYLKALSGVHRRSVKGGKPRVKDPNVQRGYEAERSAKIRKYIQYGYPLCEMSETEQRKPSADDLRKPGWLPTAIIVNILKPGTERNGVKIPNPDLVRVEENPQFATLHLPDKFSGATWKPEMVYPFEVIDGQHRLWAFEEYNPGDDFELPVVAFYGLDRSWQAYLFWSVNITPKKINRSLAFDLYPLLRRQSWLEKFEGHSIYRESRCQELVEALWSHQQSPWYQRINMLGEIKEQREYKGSAVTQAAWVRSLMSTFVKQWEGKGVRGGIGGLFGAPPKADQPMLLWNRVMQAAFLIYAGNALKKSIGETKSNWAEHLRKADQLELFDRTNQDDPSFYGNYSLISTDQGIRGFLFIVNDLCFAQSKALQLEEWRWDDIDVPAQHSDDNYPATDEELVTAAIKSFAKTKAAGFIDAISQVLATYDWRTSSTPGLSQDARLGQSVFRGSSGYGEMRRQLLLHLQTGSHLVSSTAKSVTKALGYK